MLPRRRRRRSDKEIPGNLVMNDRYQECWCGRSSPYLATTKLNINYNTKLLRPGGWDSPCSWGNCARHPSSHPPKMVEDDDPDKEKNM